MTFEEETLIREMLRRDAGIDMQGTAGPFPVYAAGSRRTRPIRWVEKETVTRLLGRDIIRQKGRWVTVSKAYRPQQSAPQAKTAVPEVEERTIYQPGGSARPTRVRNDPSVLHRLGRKTDRFGRTCLSSAQIEAGEHFARDYILSGCGDGPGRNYEAVKVDGGFRHDASERAIISRMDRRRRVTEALACLGPGLEQILVAVCCENLPIEHVERTEQWAKGAGLTVLRLALDRLVKFYGTLPGV